MILAGRQFNERDLIGRVLRSAVPVKKAGAGVPRWVWVSNHFSMGSTVSCALCREFGLDPDERVNK